MREDEVQARKLAKSFRRKLTDAETILWSRLRRNSVHKIRRQHPVGPFIADFACVAAKVVIEVDGASHGTDEGMEHDRKRDTYMRRFGWRIVRVANHEVYGNLDDALDYIGAVLDGLVPD